MSMLQRCGCKREKTLTGAPQCVEASLKIFQLMDMVHDFYLMLLNVFRGLAWQCNG